ncbi:rod shape-determining protein RodA, partial [Bacteroidota bacterium]
MKIKRDIGAKIDWLSIIIFLILIFIGWLNIYSAVYNEESTGIFDINQKYGRQLIWIIASLLVAFIILIIDSKFY